MRKWKTVVIIILFLCLIPCITALAKTGKVTASSLNIRKSADSDSKVVGTLREGASVTIKESTGSWYKISAGGKTGQNTAEREKKDGVVRKCQCAF